MRSSGDPISILRTEYDGDHRLRTGNASSESRVDDDLHVLPEGIDMPQYPQRENRQAKLSHFARARLPRLPGPRMKSRERLRGLQADPDFGRIPVVAITSSGAENDVVRSYEPAAASYCTGPSAFSPFVELISSPGLYWVDCARSP
jgi:hypothetical protein